jgi:hypothetical protein
MKTLLLLLLCISNALAVTCDCDIRIHSPIGSSLEIGPIFLKTLKVESFSSYSVKNQWKCRQSCLEEFQAEMPNKKLKSFLKTYTQELISQGRVGYNCTGLTVLKFPVRVRARLANYGLGNILDQVETLAHEEICFN